MLRTLPLLALALAPCVAAQVEWTPTYGGRANHVMFHDEVRNVTVLFGGNSGAIVHGDAWELAATATEWTELELQNGPEALEGHAIAYDTGRDQAVMFGGRTVSAVVKNTTWIWDGGGVNGPPVVTKPDPRFDHAMAFDEARGKIVMFGGTGAVGQRLGDTWEWDGTDWKRRTPATSPTPRCAHAMAYDPTLQTVVLFGGNDAARKNDLWSWDGATGNWVLLHSGTGSNVPSPREGCAMAREAEQTSRVLLIAGQSDQGFENDAWTWSQGSWRQLAVDRQFPGRTAHRAAAVAGGTVILAGGSTNERAFSDVWELEQVSTDKIRWVLRVANDTPPTREESAFGIASDARRGRLVLVSSNPNTCPWRSETWEWDGNASAWRDAGEGAKREPSGFAMAYVPTGQRLCVVTGGLVANNDCSPRGPTDKVTAWDGSRWGDHNVMPGARHLHAMTYDPVRDRLILFGGFDSVGTSAPRNQTWEATGQDLDWTIRTPATNPPFTIAAHMTYDEVRRRTVLLTQTTSGPEHWQWDGNNWTRVTPATPPPFGPLAFDALRARVVCNGDDELVWEWDGIDWRSRGASPTRGRLAYDSTRQEIVAVDRDGSVWYFGPTHAATYATFGTGCPGSRGIPALRGTQLPWIGCPFSITFDNLPAQPGIVWIGFSNSLWNTLPLPFDLSLIGISNCLLYTGIESSYPIANNAWSFNIPNLAALLGARFYNQALILDPGTNPFGAVVTNAGEAVIGGK